MIEWDNLRFFLAVARTGSSSGAARELRVNQSTVVRRIESLENDLKLILFHKKREGYRLTPQGEALLEEANAVEASVFALVRKASALDDALDGTLRVTTAEGMALGLVPQLLEEFQRRHPGIQVDLVIEDRYSDLSDGKAEVALRAGPPGEGTLVGRKLSDQSWAGYANHSYVERFGKPEGAQDLGRHRLVGFEGGIENITPARWLRAVAPQCEFASRSNSVLGLLLAAQSGLGLALLPCQIGDRDTSLTRVIEPQSGLTAGFWILTHPELQHRPKIRVFFDFMVREIRKYRPLLLGQSLQGMTPSRLNEPQNSSEQH